MGVLVVLINLVIIGVSVVSVVSYLANRKSLQRRQRAIQEHIAGSREISSEEIRAFKHFYKKSIPVGTQVYTVVGPLESISLGTKYGTSSEYWIGGVKVVLTGPHMETLVRAHSENYCEFVYVSGKKNLAYPLLLNGSSLLEGFEGTPSEDPRTPNRSAPLPIRSRRNITHTEQRFLRRERKIVGALMLLPCAVLLHAGLAFSFEAVQLEHANYSIVLPGLACFVVSLWVFFMKRPYREDAQKVLGITGTLHKKEKVPGQSGVHYALEGTNYHFSLPKRYVKLANIPEDKPVTMEVYLQPERSLRGGALLSVQDFSIEKLLGRRLVLFAAPLFQYAIVLFVVGLVWFFSGERIFHPELFVNDDIPVVEESLQLTRLEQADAFQLRDFPVMEGRLSGYIPYGDGLSYRVSTRIEESVEGLMNSWTVIDDFLQRELRYEDGSPVTISDPTLFSDARRTVRARDPQRFLNRVGSGWRFRDDEHLVAELNALRDQPLETANFRTLTVRFVEAFRRWLQERSLEIFEEGASTLRQDMRSAASNQIFLEGWYRDDPELELAPPDPRWQSYDYDTVKAAVDEGVRGRGDLRVWTGEFAVLSPYRHGRIEIVSFGEAQIASLRIVSALSVWIVAGLCLIGFTVKMVRP